MNLFPLLGSLMATLQGLGLPADVVPAPPAPDKVIVRVNGAEIRASDIEALLWDWRGAEVTQDLVTFQLIRGEAQRVGVAVTPAEVERGYQEQLRRIAQSGPKGRDVEATLREQGMPKSRLYLRTQTELLLDRLAEREFRPEAYVRVATLAFRPTGEKAADREAARVRATKAHERLLKGEAWDRVVRELELDPDLKERNGLLGWRALSAFPSEAQAEFRTLRIGGVARPIATPSGYQLFRLEMRGQDAQAEALADLRAGALARGRQDLLQRLRREAKIEQFIGTGPGSIRPNQSGKG